MKFLLGLLLCIALSHATPVGNAVNNNNVNGNDINEAFEEFRRANKIPPWALIQRTPWGVRSFFKRELDIKVEATCLFNTTSSLLSCSGPRNVECAAEAISDIRITSFNAFGISATPIGDVTKTPESVKYSLFARKLDKTGWKHAKIRDSKDKRVHEYSLYSSPQINDSGFRIRDSVCWGELVKFFSDITRTETITLGTKPGKLDEVKIIGKIFIDRV